MATESRRPDPSLAEQLFEEAPRFDFFQAVRLLERLRPGRRPVGRDSDPAREVVRFRTRASLTFPPSQIHQLTEDSSEAGDRPPQMMVSFMGLTGPLGVLPPPYTELLIERARAKDRALWEFLDIFNHRMLSFFYRAWEKYRFGIAFERGTADQFTESLFNVIGLGTGGLRGRLSLQDQGLLYYSGLIAQRPHSASAVQAILSDYFGVPVAVEQFSGQWLKLDEESLTRLGTANNRLGVDSVAGTRVWDNQAKFRLKVGPLDLKEFTSFLPPGSAFQPLTELTRLLVGLEFDFAVQPILQAAEVPGWVLTTRAKRRPMLGWTTWLKTQPVPTDDEQVVLAVPN